MHCARWTAKKPSWVYDSGDFWGEGILLCLDWKLGRCHSQVPTARQHAANGCNRDGQMSRTGVLYSSNSSAATGARPRYLRSPKTAATRRIRRLGGIQLHKSTLASQGGGRPRERATGSGGQTSQACQPSFNRTLGRDPERKLLAGLCGHRPPLAFTWWVNVPSIQWYFRGHGRTSPDLELCANRCAILH